METDNSQLHAGGRPSKLNDEVIEQALYYIENHQDFGDVVPTIEGLAYELHVARSTLYKWADEHDGFSYIFERLKAAQAKKLLSGGLSSELNATITKLMLTKHDYSDKQETDIKTNGKDITVPSVFVYEVLADENQDT